MEIHARGTGAGRAAPPPALRIASSSTTVHALALFYPIHPRGHD
jgi:hypothetical protein